MKNNFIMLTIFCIGFVCSCEGQTDQKQDQQIIHNNNDMNVDLNDLPVQIIDFETVDMELNTDQ